MVVKMTDAVIMAKASEASRSRLIKLACEIAASTWKRNMAGSNRGEVALA